MNNIKNIKINYIKKNQLKKLLQTSLDDLT